MRFHTLLLMSAVHAKSLPPNKTTDKDEVPSAPKINSSIDDTPVYAEAKPVVVGSEDYCHGKQVTYEACEGQNCVKCDPVNCELGPWNEWSACLCEGLKERNRVIQKHNNECGKPCNADLIETAQCEIECLKSPTDCTLSDWSDWDGCDEVRQYQQERTRTYTDPENGGDGCSNSTREIIPCPDAPKPEDKDCVWNDWSSFSACTCSCDGGQKTRDRSVLEAPRGTGKHCDPLAKTEVAPCNTQKCSEMNKCVDGAWDDWNGWEPCSAECGGGVQWRTRDIARQANECGLRALGNRSEVRACNTQSCMKTTDCEFGNWGDWSDCSCTCEGIQHRSRVISQYGAEGGAYCQGGTKEVMACNNYTNQPGCKAEPPVDCVLGDWEKGKCTATCGGGQLEWVRSVKVPNDHGGKPCNGTLSKTLPCNTQSCEKKPPIDCLWNEWSEWSVCDKCGGQRKRSRTISRMPHNMGQPCHFEDSEQTGKCPRECHKPVYCVWSEWSEVSKCSSECGPGFKSKERSLVATTDKPARLFEEIAPVSAQSRLQEVSISFACGSLVTFLILMVTMRVFRRENRDWNTIRRDPEQHQLIDMRAAE